MMTLFHIHLRRNKVMDLLLSSFKHINKVQLQYNTTYIFVHVVVVKMKKKFLDLHQSEAF